MKHAPLQSFNAILKTYLLLSVQQTPNKLQ